MRSFISFILLLTAFTVHAQVPNKFNYQAVARDAAGRALAGKNISVRINILDGGATAPSVYGETRSVTTNQLGLFSMAIGDGGATSTTGNFSTISWSTGKKYISVEVDPLGGSNFVSLGSNELLSVPYALYAVNGTPGPQGATGPAGPTGATGATGPQGAAGTVPQIGFSARLSTTIAVSSTYMVPTNLAPYTKFFDDGNNFNATTGEFTAPSAGVYHFEYTPNIGTNAGSFTDVPCYPRAMKNGTAVSSITTKLSITNGYGQSAPFIFTLKLAAGDKITVEFNLVAPSGSFTATGGGTAGASTFSGWKVY